MGLITPLTHEKIKATQGNGCAGSTSDCLVLFRWPFCMGRRNTSWSRRIGRSAVMNLEQVGNVGTDEHTEIISEHQYKRECYRVCGGLLFLFAGGFLWGVNRDMEGTRRTRKFMGAGDIESREPARRSRNIQSFIGMIFKKWINENHPHLKIWTLPTPKKP